MSLRGVETEDGVSLIKSDIKPYLRDVPELLTRHYQIILNRLVKLIGVGEF